MEAMREAWTDERLDDLSKRVDVGFREAREDMRAFRREARSDTRSVRTELKADFASLRSEMDARFDKMDARFDKVDQKFETLEQRFERRFDLMFIALLTGFASLIVAHFVG
jgi:tetrahydromethanopterin S-methyltransferase subunit G